jgi:hypothetical protein
MDSSSVFFAKRNYLVIEEYVLGRSLNDEDIMYLPGICLS